MATGRDDMLSSIGDTGNASNLPGNISTSELRLRRAALTAAVNELELQIRQLCEKQNRALALAHQIEELIAGEPA